MTEGTFISLGTDSEAKLKSFKNSSTGSPREAAAGKLERLDTSSMGSTGAAVGKLKSLDTSSMGSTGAAVGKLKSLDASSMGSSLESPSATAVEF